MPCLGLSGLPGETSHHDLVEPERFEREQA